VNIGKRGARRHRLLCGDAVGRKGGSGEQEKKKQPSPKGSSIAGKGKKEVLRKSKKGGTAPASDIIAGGESELITEEARISLQAKKRNEDTGGGKVSYPTL